MSAGSVTDSGAAGARLNDLDGAIQPHGALIVVSFGSQAITHASANCLLILGLSPSNLFGMSIVDLLGAQMVEALVAVLDNDDDAGNPTFATVGERPFDLIVHRVDDSMVIEFEPWVETPAAMTRATRKALRRFGSVNSVTELWSLAATEFRRITGFDRVLVEHFHPDGHGEIVAESVSADLEPRLGLRMPRASIPSSAMTLAARKLSRLIVSTEAPPVALLSDPRRNLPPVDLSKAELRTVSPHHLAFMRQHDMVSSFTLSLVRNHALIGMIMGGHRTERRLPYNIRDEFEILANQVSLQLVAMRDLELLAQRNERRNLRGALVAQLARRDDLPDALLHSHVTLLDLIPARGVVIKMGERTDSVGTTADHEDLLRLADRLASVGAPRDVATSQLAADYPSVAETLRGVAGLLLQRLSHEGDYIAWFRGERERFAGWAEEFDGTSEPWGDLETEARELARDLQASLLRRAESRLAELALRDPLTGLPNRRLLMERLEQELLSLRRGEQLAVLYVDLDEFKQINDSFGHAAGDAALLRTAEVLRNTARREDTVARLGGDEFVVLCPGVSPTFAGALAERFLTAVSAREGEDVFGKISASFGLALADRSMDVSQVLNAADAALYRAKSAGKGQMSQ